MQTTIVVTGQRDPCALVSTCDLTGNTGQGLVLENILPIDFNLEDILNPLIVVNGRQAEGPELPEDEGCGFFANAAGSLAALSKGYSDHVGALSDAGLALSFLTRDPRVIAGTAIAEFSVITADAATIALDDLAGNDTTTSMRELGQNLLPGRQIARAVGKSEILGEIFGSTGYRISQQLAPPRPVRTCKF